MEYIINAIGGTTTVGIILDFYFVFILVLFILRFVYKNRKVINAIYILLVMGIIWYITTLLNLKVSSQIFTYIMSYSPIIAIIIFAPEIRKVIEGVWRSNKKDEILVSSNNQTKQSIIEAVEHLSIKRIGALITIEKYNSLDQYAEKAVTMNADVTKELLINIFTPLTPLHDGAVIIRGDKIRCAAAYYVLTETNTDDKTMGSRHRAALGISEVSDSLTIVVSEETGTISITIEGIMLHVNDKDKLLEYIDMFMR